MSKSVILMKLISLGLYQLILVNFNHKNEIKYIVIQLLSETQMNHTLKEI